MKRTLLILIFCTGICGPFFAQDTALPRLAVAEFNVNDTTEAAARDAITVREVAESELVKTQRYDVIARDEIDELLASEEIRVNDMTSAENVEKLRARNISYLVIGSINTGSDGSEYVITIRILDVEAGRFFRSENAVMGNNLQELHAGITRLISALTAEKPTICEIGPPPQSPPSPVVYQDSYKIGDRGPGGGIIFFAEEGQYMECSGELGRYRWNDAVPAAQNYTGGGFTDWRLPTRKELDLLYQNLKENQLGEFSNGYHWASLEYNRISAWSQRFDDGYQVTNFKRLTYAIRAVRSFSR
ncbi:MAG: DUF1566 domain-containing protein [Treponema sp.]|nr:DUF1566 domain-containing protein [Treponema sp.]